VPKFEGTLEDIEKTYTKVVFGKKSPAEDLKKDIKKLLTVNEENITQKVKEFAKLTEESEQRQKDIIEAISTLDASHGKRLEKFKGWSLDTRAHIKQAILKASKENLSDEKREVLKKLAVMSGEFDDSSKQLGVLKGDIKDSVSELKHHREWFKNFKLSARLYFDQLGAESQEFMTKMFLGPFSALLPKFLDPSKIAKDILRWGSSKFMGAFRSTIGTLIPAPMKKMFRGISSIFGKPKEPLTKTERKLDSIKFFLDKRFDKLDITVSDMESHLSSAISRGFEGVVGEEMMISEEAAPEKKGGLFSGLFNMFKGKMGILWGSLKPIITAWFAAAAPMIAAVIGPALAVAAGGLIAFVVGTKLNKLLNEHFGKQIEFIDEMGGDLISKFMDFGRGEVEGFKAIMQGDIKRGLLRQGKKKTTFEERTGKTRSITTGGLKSSRLDTKTSGLAESISRIDQELDSDQRELDRLGNERKTSSAPKVAEPAGERVAVAPSGRVIENNAIEDITIQAMAENGIRLDNLG